MRRRVRVEGDLFHGRVPPGAEYVGRGAPGLKASPYANPHAVGRPCRACHGTVHTLAEAVQAYRAHLAASPDLVARARAELTGRDLACWCRLPAPGEPDLCHAAVLLEILGASS